MGVVACVTQPFKLQMTYKKKKEVKLNLSDVINV